MSAHLIIKPEDSLAVTASVSRSSPSPTISAEGAATQTVAAPVKPVVSIDAITSAQKVAMGLASTAAGIAEAAKQAGFAVGFGSFGAGAVYLFGEQIAHGNNNALGLLIIGAFFICASLGKLLDRKLRLP